MSQHSSRGGPWRRLREDAMVAAGGRCICGAKAVEAHHILPREAGGWDGLDNLQVLCGACHAAKHEKRPPRERPRLASRFAPGWNRLLGGTQ